VARRPDCPGHGRRHGVLALRDGEPGDEQACCRGSITTRRVPPVNQYGIWSGLTGRVGCQASADHVLQTHERGDTRTRHASPRFDATHELGPLVCTASTRCPDCVRWPRRKLTGSLPRSVRKASVLAPGLWHVSPDRIMAPRTTWHVAAITLNHRLYEFDPLTSWGYGTARVQMSRIGYPCAEPEGMRRESSQLLARSSVPSAPRAITPQR
jgi:hypothetical protein